MPLVQDLSVRTTAEGISSRKRFIFKQKRGIASRKRIRCEQNCQLCRRGNLGELPWAFRLHYSSPAPEITMMVLRSGAGNHRWLHSQPWTWCCDRRPRSPQQKHTCQRSPFLLSELPGERLSRMHGACDVWFPGAPSEIEGKYRRDWDADGTKSI